MDRDETGLLQETLDLPILKTLALAPMHACGTPQRIQRVSQDVPRVTQGSRYPDLHRLEVKRLVTSEMGTSGNNRQARFYHMTAAGRRRLSAGAGTWGRRSLAVGRALLALPETG